MVFPGRRSIGCYTCRQRKVKCDATRPACGRCTKFGRKCGGYPDTFKFKSYNGCSFSDPAQLPGSEEEYSAESTGSANGENSSEGAISAVVPLSHYETSSISQSWYISPLLDTTCSDSSSLAYFMHHHVVVIHKSPCGGHLAFLPDLYREKGTAPCLKHAIQSVAYLSLFNRHSAPALWYQARKNYSLALAALAAAIDTPESASGHEVFASSLFLSMFIDLSSERKGRNDHIAGMHALLQLRTPEGKYGRRLLAWASTQMVQAIASDQYQYALLPPLLKGIQRPDSVSGAVRLLGLISEFCQSMQDTRNTLLWRPDQPSTVQAPLTNILGDLAWKLKHVFYEIDHWHACLPYHWKRQLHRMKLSNGVHGEGIGLSGQDPWTTCFLAVISSAHLAFYVQCLDNSKYFLLASDSSGSWLSLYNVEGRIRETITVICSAVRYTLGSLDVNNIFEPVPSYSSRGIGHNLLASMELVARCRFALPGQILLCTQALRFLRR
ncbi:hypothetical protein BJX64DRAFT_287292 [Aspergillus heterothallicus]